MEQEKDYFWYYIGALIIAVIFGVFLLKSREMESVPVEAHSQLNQQVEKQMQNAKGK
jgi:hypothetical protein